MKCPSLFPGDKIFAEHKLRQQWLKLGQVPFKSCMDILLNQTNSSTMTHEKRIGIKHGSKIKISHLGIYSKHPLINQLYAYSDLFLWGACGHLNLTIKVNWGLIFCFQNPPENPYLKVYIQLSICKGGGNVCILCTWYYS